MQTNEQCTKLYNGQAGEHEYMGETDRQHSDNAFIGIKTSAMAARMPIGLRGGTSRLSKLPIRLLCRPPAKKSGDHAADIVILRGYAVLRSPESVAHHQALTSKYSCGPVSFLLDRVAASSDRLQHEEEEVASLPPQRT